MTAKAPPIPQAQQPSRGARPDVAGGDRRDGDVNLKQQGRQGGVHQNITHQGRQQDR